MNLLSDPRWSEALAHLPDYLGNHVRVSVTVITDQPPGRYSGVVMNTTGNEIVGSLTVEIAGPYAPSA